MAPRAIVDALKASQAEQVPVTVHYRGGQARGTVARLDDETVELRPPAGRGRTLVVLAQVDAVTLE